MNPCATYQPGTPERCCNVCALGTRFQIEGNAPKVSCSVHGFKNDDGTMHSADWTDPLWVCKQFQITPAE